MLGQALWHQHQDSDQVEKSTSVADLPTGPKQPRPTVLSIKEETAIVAFRQHTLLLPDDCLYALQPAIQHLSRSSWHR